MKRESLDKSVDQTDLLLLLITAFWIIIYLHCSIYRYFDHDEFEAIHTAWKITKGETIYVDFFQHHHPMSYYFIVPLIKVFGESITTILVSRLAFLVTCVGILYLTYRIALLCLGARKAALVSVILLLNTDMFFLKSIEIRPDVLLTFWGLLSIICLVRYLEDLKVKYGIVSAISLAISFLCLQKSIFFMLGVGIVLATEIFLKRIAVKDVLLYMVVCSAPIIIYLICIYPRSVIFRRGNSF